MFIKIQLLLHSCQALPELYFIKTEQMSDLKIIGESTAVKLGVVIALACGIISFTWWASGVQSSLNVLISGQVRGSQTIITLDQRTTLLERSSDIMMSVGSPALRPRLDSLERWRERIDATGSPQVVDIIKRLTVLEGDLKLHMSQPHIIVNKP